VIAADVIDMREAEAVAAEDSAERWAQAGDADARDGFLATAARAYVEAGPWPPSGGPPPVVTPTCARPPGRGPCAPTPQRLRCGVRRRTSSDGPPGISPATLDTYTTPAY